MGEFLVRRQYFSDAQEATVQLRQEEGRYRLRFVIDSAYADDRLAIQYGVIGSEISRTVLGGRPIEVGLLDANLESIKVLPSSAKLAFGKSALYYTDPATASEARAVGEQLVRTGFFRDDRGTMVHLGHEAGAYQLRFIADPSRAADPEVRAAFREVGHVMSTEALGGQPVGVHLCDERFRTIHRERP